MDPRILICGAGPTGLVLAIWLAKRKVPFRIIDKAAKPGTASRALVIHARTLEYYRMLELDKAVVNASVHMDEARLWVNRRIAGTVRFGGVATNTSAFPYVLVFPQDEHEALLEKELNALGKKVERGTELLTYQELPGGVDVRLRTPSGDIENAIFSWLAGCDGASSRVRELAGAGFPGGTYEHIFYVADITGTGPVINGELNIALDDSDFLAVFPLKGEGRARLIGTVTGKKNAGPEKIPDPHTHSLPAAAKPQVPPLVSASTIGEPPVFPSIHSPIATGTPTPPSSAALPRTPAAGGSISAAVISISAPTVAPALASAGSRSAMTSGSSARSVLLARTTGPTLAAASAQPQAASTQPQAASTQPQAASTQPQAALTQPQAASTQPKTTSAQPQTASAKPQAASTQPQAASTQPQTASTDAASTQPKAASAEAASGEPLQWEDVSHGIFRRINLDIQSVNWFSTYRVHHRVASFFRKGRVFLLGDAAHVHSPFGGQGMNTGIGDAVNLAWKFEAVLKRGAPDSILDSYEQERIGFARRLVDTTDRAFTFINRKSAMATGIRTRIVPLLLPIIFKRPAFRRRMFSILSQTRITYRGTPLNSGIVGAIHSGDRLPWLRQSDNFAPLKNLDWQLHCYGEAKLDLLNWCERYKMPLHFFAAAEPFRPGTLCLVRPDGHVGWVGRSTDLPSLSRYVNQWRIA